MNDEYTIRPVPPFHFLISFLYSLINKTILHNLCIAFIIVLLLLPYLIFFFLFIRTTFSFSFSGRISYSKKRNALGFCKQFYCPLYKNSPLFIHNHFLHDFDLKVYRVMLTHLSAVIFLPSTLFNTRIIPYPFYNRFVEFASYMEKLFKCAA